MQFRWQERCLAWLLQLEAMKSWLKVCRLRVERLASALRERLQVEWPVLLPRWVPVQLVQQVLAWAQAVASVETAPSRCCQRLRQRLAQGESLIGCRCWMRWAL